jgi:PelA/Pel-15E family pectate lyase
MRLGLGLLFIVLLKGSVFAGSAEQSQMQKDSLAERMLLFQRSNGGWCQPGGDPINYNKEVTKELRTKLKKEKDKNDTTIDDESTTKEITYLLDAFDKTQNSVYLSSAERGIKYLLDAQYPSGGWSQFFPDTSGYRKHITFNDNAMINVLWVMKKTAEKEGAFRHLSDELSLSASTAVEQGVKCILRCQYIQNGIKTVWCAQHNRDTFLPAKARAFELPSLSGAESVGIVRFLLSIKNPNTEIKESVNAALAWFEKAAIQNKDTKLVYNEKGKAIDRIIFDAEGSTIWARFYDLDTNQPFFVGRDSQPKSELKDIEQERRVGYSFYGHYAENLINKEYPKWKQKWNN